VNISSSLSRYNCLCSELIKLSACDLRVVDMCTGEGATAGKDTCALNGSRKRSRNEAVPNHMHASAQGGVEARHRVKRAEDWASFLHRSGTSNRNCDAPTSQRNNTARGTVQQQRVEETSSSAEESNDEEGATPEFVRQGKQAQGRDGKPVPRSNSNGQLSGPILVTGVKDVARNEEEESSGDEDSESEDDESSDEDESLEESGCSSSSEEEEDKAVEQVKVKSLVSLHSVAGQINAKAKQMVASAGPRTAAAGMGRGQVGLKEGVVEGMNTYGSEKKLMFDVPSEEDEGVDILLIASCPGSMFRFLSHLYSVFPCQFRMADIRAFLYDV
jgi:hypothetical protein